MTTTNARRIALLFEQVEALKLNIQRSDEPVGSFGQWLPQVSPTMTWDWPWIEYVTEHLDRVTDGEISRLMIFAPPRHGKTSLVTVRYPIYRLVRDPQTPVIMAAYNATLAQKFSRMARRIARRQLTLSDERSAVADWETTAGGGVRAVGVGEGVAGHGGRLILVDDPVKSREEADSLTFRDRVMEWWTDDLMTRRDPGAAVVLIQTRWHEDDLAGRILNSDDGKNWHVIRLPALAEDDDPLGRAPGEALCPELFDEDALEDSRQVMGQFAFDALYQQRPTGRRGELFDPAWFPMVDADEVPADGEAVLWFDRAATEGGGDYTAGCLAVRKGQDTWLHPLLHVRHTAGQRDRLMKNLADQIKDERPRGRLVVWSEQEPGSSGKDGAEAFRRLMIGHGVRTERTTGSKPSRADAMAAQAELGHVKIVRCPLARVLLEEARTFDRGTHDDMIESAFSAFNVLARGSGINRSPSPKSTAFFSG